MARVISCLGIACLLAGCAEAPSESGLHPAVESLPEGLVQPLPTCGPAIQLADTDSTSCTSLPPMDDGTWLVTPLGDRWSVDAGLLSRRDGSGTRVVARVRIPVGLTWEGDQLVLVAEDGRRWAVSTP